jgi:anti-sigma factor RsiW
MFRRHVFEQLAAHIDGVLPPREAQRAERHMAQCPRCRAEREEVQFGITMLEHLPTAKAPDELWAGIEAAIARAEPVPGLRRWRPALAAVALVAVAGAAYWSLAGRGERRAENG